MKENNKLYDMNSDNTRATGGYFEDMACQYLSDRGYTVLSRNFRCRLGEIDIIARDGDHIVFVEVKYRKNFKSGYPAESVGIGKIKRISAAAAFYIHKNRLPLDMPYRFDVVSIEGNEITHIVNAFEFLR